MSDDFELGGEDEMSLRQAWPFQRNYVLREVWDASQNRWAFVFIIHIHLLYFLMTDHFNR